MGEGIIGTLCVSTAGHFDAADSADPFGYAPQGDKSLCVLRFPGPDCGDLSQGRWIDPLPGKS